MTFLSLLNPKAIAVIAAFAAVLGIYFYIGHLKDKVAEAEQRAAALRFEVQALTVGREQLLEAAKASSKKAEKVRTITVTKIKEIKVPSSCPEQLDYLYEVAK